MYYRTMKVVLRSVIDHLCHHNLLFFSPQLWQISRLRDLFVGADLQSYIDASRAQIYWYNILPGYTDNIAVTIIKTFILQI